MLKQIVRTMGCSEHLSETFVCSVENLILALDSLALSPHLFCLPDGDKRLEWQRLGKQGSLQHCSTAAGLGLTCMSSETQRHLAPGPRLVRTWGGPARDHWADWLGREKLRRTAF